jgi:hypothetical protein
VKSIFQSGHHQKSQTSISESSGTMSKRSIKPKTIFSPSNPAEASTYHLIIYSDTNAMTIVGHSSVKRLENNGIMMLNNGRQGQLIISGN